MWSVSCTIARTSSDTCRFWSALCISGDMGKLVHIEPSVNRDSCTVCAPTYPRLQSQPSPRQSLLSSLPNRRRSGLLHCV